MKYVILICALSLGCALPPLRAGYVVTISDASESTGKVILTAKGVQVQTGSSPTDITLDQILEADFSDAPFQLNFFSSNGAKGTQVPPNWKSQDIGDVDAPGSITAADGVYTVSGSGNFPKLTRKGPATDRLFFAGQQWLGDGQWTVRIKDIDAQSPDTSAGLMVRDSLEPGSIETLLETSTLGAGVFAYREKADAASRPEQIAITPPVWVRFTRIGMSIFATVSTDQQQWDLIGQVDFKSLDNPWVGLYAHTRREKEPGKATFDDLTFAPAPSSAQILPPGVILQGGSFVAAGCQHMLIDSTNPDGVGNFMRNNVPINFAGSQIAYITMLPLTRSMIASLGSKPGLIMKNGDVMDGDLQAINNGAPQVNSMLLGITSYQRTDVRACVLHPLQVQPALYEIRLKDGSMIHSNDVTISGTAISIEDISGAKIFVPLADLAQIRAGSKQVQSLAELDWKATPPSTAATPHAAPPAAPAPPVAPGAAPATGIPGTPAAAANAAPAMAPGIPVPDAPAPPLVGSWKGPNQEQVMEASAGTTIDFPLTGKYRAIAMRVMVSPDSPSAQATIRVLADGRELTRTPVFKAGEQPRFIQVTVQNPKTLSIVADSPFENTKVLFIDPVAVRN